MSAIRWSLMLVLVVLAWGQAAGQEFKEERAFRFYENCQMRYDSVKLHRYATYKVVKGDYTVFEFETDHGGDPGNHSKARTIIALQVKNAGKKFELKDAAIAENNGIYMQACICQDVGIHPIQQGTIRGRKIADDTWALEFDIHIPGRVTGKDYHIVQSQNYTLTSPE